MQNPHLDTRKHVVLGNRKNRSPRTTLAWLFELCEIKTAIPQETSLLSCTDWVKYLGKNPEKHLARTKERLLHIVMIRSWVGRRVSYIEQRPTKVEIRRTGLTRYSTEMVSIKVEGTVVDVLPTREERAHNIAFAFRPFITDKKTFSLVVRDGAGRTLRRVDPASATVISD